MNNDETFNQIGEALRMLNGEVAGNEAVVKAFYLEHDEELEGLVANVIIVLEHGKIDDGLEVLDKYCEKTSEKLGQYVKFTYCIYRTKDEFKEDFSNEQFHTTRRGIVFAMRGPVNLRIHCSIS